MVAACSSLLEVKVGFSCLNRRVLAGFFSVVAPTFLLSQIARAAVVKRSLNSVG